MPAHFECSFVFIFIASSPHHCCCVLLHDFIVHYILDSIERVHNRVWHTLHFKLNMTVDNNLARSLCIARFQPAKCVSSDISISDCHFIHTTRHTTTHRIKILVELSIIYCTFLCPRSPQSPSCPNTRAMCPLTRVPDHTDSHRSLPIYVNRILKHFSFRWHIKLHRQLIIFFTFLLPKLLLLHFFRSFSLSLFCS